MFHEDPEGDAVIVGADGPRQLFTKGYIHTVVDNRQDGNGLPSFNPQRGVFDTTDLTADDKRIIAALGQP